MKGEQWVRGGEQGRGSRGKRAGGGERGEKPRGEEQEQGLILQREQEKGKQGEGITVGEWEGNGAGEEFEGNRI